MGEPKAYLNQYWTADRNIEDVRRLTFGEKQFGDGKSANLFVFFCDDAKYFGTVGIAYVGGLCDRLGYQVRGNPEVQISAEATSRNLTHSILTITKELASDFAFP